MKDGDNSTSGGRSGGSPTTTSTTLLTRVQAGAADAWQRLVALYAPLVLWWCRRHGLREHDAEDVAQEVFKTVARRVVEFSRPDGGGFRKWLRTITHHKLGDFFRQSRREPAAAGGGDAQQHLDLVAAGADDATADQPSERALLCRRAMELIKSEFEPRSWEAAWRTAVEGQQAADVAHDLGISRSAVYTAKSRVLGRLRDELGELLQ